MIEEQKDKVNKEISRIVKDIYEQIYCEFREQYIVVFLCGGASNSKSKYIRDKVRTLLENEKKTFWNKPYKIFYPEDLLIEVLNKTKEADLLSYEQFLANNSHVGKVIAVVHRFDDVEEKRVVAPENVSFTPDEIMEQVKFQEQYFKVEIRM